MQSWLYCTYSSWLSDLFLPQGVRGWSSGGGGTGRDGYVWIREEPSIQYADGGNMDHSNHGQSSANLRWP